MYFKDIPRLNIVLSKDFVVPHLVDNYTINTFQPDILDQETLSQLLILGLEVREVQLFSASPRYQGTVHIDGHLLGSDIGAINYVINNNKDWAMEWYALKEIQNFEKRISTGSTSFLSPNLSECEIKCIHRFESACLVHVGHPHRIINFSKNPRYCISIRFFDNDFYNISKLINENYSKI